jgi:hypothetical protein
MWGYSQMQKWVFFLFHFSFFLNAADWGPADWILFSYICSNRKCARETSLAQAYELISVSYNTITGNPNASMIGGTLLMKRKLRCKPLSKDAV